MSNKMRTFNYTDAKCIVISGDIHGAFEEMVFKLCVQYGMTDTLLIVAGDCGFGFEKPGYYEQIFTKVSRRLTKANNWIAMIRGNHDDPAYFQEQRINHERFRCVPDYSIVTACYWADEMPRFDEETLAEINANYKVDTVVTHTAPSFCELITKDGLMGWASRDATLLEDCERERAILDRIFESLLKAGHPITHWYYGHFHQSWSSTIHGILFSMLDIMEFKEMGFLSK